MAKLTLSFLIPAYNDESTVADVVRDADAMGKKHASGYEIVVIDDGSKDRTAQVLKNLTRTFTNLRVKTHRVNLGYGATIRELYYEARSTWLYTSPGDNQIAVPEVEKLLPYRDDFDMIIGLRVNRQDSAVRLRQSRIYNTLLKVLFGLPLKDANSVRLMKSAIMRKVMLSARSAFVDAELAIKAKEGDYRITEVPIAHRKRESVGAGGGKLGTILPVIVDIMKFKTGLTV